MKSNAKATGLTLLSKNHAIVSTLQVTAAAQVLGLSAHIKIPLFFTPVPLSTQTFVLLLMGVFLGSRKGALAALLYLIWGGLGMPFFIGGPASFAYLAGPTGGYLMGFIVQAYLAGLFVEKFSRSNGLTAFCAFSLTCLIQLSLGSFWLAQFVGWENVWAMGFVPFIPGELLKSLITTGVLKSTRT